MTAGLDGRMEGWTRTRRSKTRAPLDRMLTWARAAAGFQTSDNEEVIVVDDALVDTRGGRSWSCHSQAPSVDPIDPIIAHRSRKSFAAKKFPFFLYTAGPLSLRGPKRAVTYVPADWLASEMRGKVLQFLPGRSGPVSSPLIREPAWALHPARRHKPPPLGCCCGCCLSSSSSSLLLSSPSFSPTLPRQGQHPPVR